MEGGLAWHSWSSGSNSPVLYNGFKWEVWPFFILTFQVGLSSTPHFGPYAPLKYFFWSKCMLEKRLLIVEAEWLTVNSTFICKSNGEWRLEIETNILIVWIKLSLRTEKRRQKFQFSYKYLLSVPILIRGDYTSFLPPQDYFLSNNLLQFCFLQLQEFIFKKI